MGTEDYTRRTAPGRDTDSDHKPGVLHKGGEEVIVDPDMAAEAAVNVEAEPEPAPAE